MCLIVSCILHLWNHEVFFCGKTDHAAAACFQVSKELGTRKHVMAQGLNYQPLFTRFATRTISMRQAFPGQKTCRLSPRALNLTLQLLVVTFPASWNLLRTKVASSTKANNSYVFVCFVFAEMYIVEISSCYAA